MKPAMTRPYSPLFPLAALSAALLMSTAQAESPTAPPTAPLTRGIAVVPAGAPAAIEDGVRIDALAGPEAAALRGLFSLQLGRPLTPQSVQALVTEVNRRLARSGQAFSVAGVPDQDVSRGQLRIEVTQGRLGRLRIEGAADPDGLASRIALRGDEALEADAVDRELGWLERAAPGRQVQAKFEPGRSPGAVDVTLQVQELPRLQWSAGADNTGSPVTGRERVSAGVTLNRLLHADDQATLRLIASPDFEHTRTLTAGYTTALPWRHLLSLNANESRIRGRMPEPLALTGGSSGQSLRYEVPLRLAGAWTDGVVLGFDHKRSDNNLLFSETPVTQTVTRIGQFLLGYQARQQDDWGSTRLSLNLVMSPGGLADTNEDAAFDATRPGATARYRYVQLQADRSTPLGPLTWAASVTLQQANANLLGSEQINGGGVSGVRGFAEGAGFGDSGWVWRNELRGPAWQPGGGVIVTPSLLADAAQLRVHRAQPGEPAKRTLASAGVGLSASLPGGFWLQLQWSQRLRSGLLAQPKGGDRLHVSLQWNWL